MTGVAGVAGPGAVTGSAGAGGCPAATGSVAPVGAGPGDPDLLTVRGLRLLEAADVIVADRLGARNVLDGLAAAGVHLGAEVVDVGKLPGHHAVPQDAINALLVQLAAAGRRVVRLKGGDPFVYGRGGEEVIACRAAGVPVDVVPGISTAIAVPAGAGIPVTHRGVAGAVLVVNGQDAMTESTSAALRDAATTVVVLMGVSALARFAADALTAGASPDLPVACVENGHTPEQRIIRTRLSQAATDAAAAGLSNPAVLVFGDVARPDLLLPEGLDLSRRALA